MHVLAWAVEVAVALRHSVHLKFQDVDRKFWFNCCVDLILQIDVFLLLKNKYHDETLKEANCNRK